MLERNGDKRRLALLVIATVAYLVAWNRGVPVLYGFSATALSLFLLGMLLPRMALHPVTVVRRHAAQACEDEALHVSLLVRNERPRALRLVELIDAAPPLALENGSPIAFVGYLRGGAERTLEYRLSCYKRGHYSLGPLGMATDFPLGLTSRELTLEGTTSEFWVSPRMVDIARFPFAGDCSIDARGVPSPRTGSGEEFAGVREYRSGDSPRHLHWRASADRGELVVREFERIAAAQCVIAIDAYSAALADAGRDTTLDVSARIAASIARHALVRRRFPVQLLARGRRHVHRGSSGNDSELQGLLRALAELEPGHEPFARALVEFTASVPPHATLVAVHTDHGRAAIEAALSSVAARAVFVVQIVLHRVSFGAQATQRQPVEATRGFLPTRYGLALDLRAGDDLAQALSSWTD